MPKTQHIDETAAWELVLGAERPADLLSHLDACPQCRRRLAETAELAPLLGAGAPVLSRSPALRAQLVGEAAHLAGAAGLEHRAESVAAHLGLPQARAEAALARLADPAAWLDVLPGFSVCMLGKSGDADLGFARAAAGSRFPDHRHLDAEHILVLQGSCEDSRAGWLGPGDRVLHPAGTHHSFTVPAAVPLLFAFTSRGIEFTGR